MERVECYSMAVGLVIHAGGAAAIETAIQPVGAGPGGLGGLGPN